MKKIAALALLVSVLFVFSCSNPVEDGDDGDVVAPTVISTLPAGNATAVARNVSLEVTFSEEMDSESLNTVSFTLLEGSTPIVGAVNTLAEVVGFDPTEDLAANTLYTATVTIAAKDLAGNALAEEKVWNFTTGGTTLAGPAAVDLGTALDLDRKSVV